MRFEALQLKVCEGCGSLWFRSRVAATVYCYTCAVKLSVFPVSGAERRPGRKTKHSRMANGGVL